MRVAILYRSNSEFERIVLEYNREYERRTGRKITMYDLNTRDGYATATLYDIMQHPAVLALADDGQLLQLWVGEKLPLINDVMYYDSSL